MACGKTKPENLQFLHEAVEELRCLLENGLEYNAKIINIVLKFIVSDTPAKCFIKCVKLYSGYNRCDKCNQRGFYCERRMTYPEIVGLQLRDNRSFRQRSDANQHHTVLVSPFCVLSIDMVEDFPIDYMHQSCLGVIQKLLITWMRDTDKKGVKISAAHKNDISAKLLELKKCVPKALLGSRVLLMKLIFGKQPSTGNFYCILVKLF